MAAQMGASLCDCGHVGDIPANLTDTYIQRLDVCDHGGVQGHGACRVAGCPCTKFSWKCYVWEDPLGDATQEILMARKEHNKWRDKVNTWLNEGEGRYADQAPMWPSWVAAQERWVRAIQKLDAAL